MKEGHSYYVYILSNISRTVLYIGFTNNVVRRIIEHREGMGSIFTKKYKIKYLLYFEVFESTKRAIEREKELKGWLRIKKFELIKGLNSEFRDLSNDLINEYGISDKDYKEIVLDLRNKR